MFTDLAGIAPVEAVEPVTIPTETDVWRPPALVNDSVTARTLFAVWSGHNEVVTVSSPPGGGKSTLIATVVAHLATRVPNMQIGVGCPTNAQADGLAAKLHRVLPPKSGILVTLGKVKNPAGRDGGDGKYASRVLVGTLASLAARPPECDLLICDEAAQATFSDVTAAAASAAALLLVGDPGQIGPVVTVDTSEWASLANAPHKRALDAFCARERSVNLTIDATFRLGPVSAALVAPLYGFGFCSQRPARQLTDTTGLVVPEVSSIEVPDVSDYNDERLMRTAVDRVAQLVGFGEVRDGHPVGRLGATDVALVVARNSQRQMAQAILAGLDLEGVAVGTADLLQGGEWHGVVSVDPVIGATDIGEHNVSLGRLCVMVSRHASHLTWVHSTGWRDAIVASDLDARTRAAAINVRDGLTAA